MSNAKTVEVTSSEGQSRLNLTPEELAVQLTQVKTNEDDIAEINEILPTKVDKVEGKGLSTNDFTNAYKNALDTYEERYEELVETVETAANNANQKANAANNAANLANTKAGLAQEAADVASEKAETAQNAATTAMNKATIAQDAATSANTAATSANNAASLATEKATLAAEKASAAESAATDASEKATEANNAATLASEKATAAQSAATLANEKATAANSAAQSATTAANLAQQKAEAAETAATEASEAATEASAKADAAQSAAESANDAATSANTKATLAQEAATLANQKAELANTAATNASTQATAAQQAATNASTQATAAQTAASNADAKATLAQTAAENANDAAEEAMEAATQVITIVKGYYYNGSFYEDEEHETEITPSESKVYIDRTSGAVNQQYLWNGEEYEAIAIDSREVEQMLEDVTDLKEQVEAYIGMGKETVVVTVTTSVQGVSVDGLVLNVYLNNSTTPDQYETDEDGMVAFRVDSGYTYRIVFPNIQGCAEVGDVIHTASVAQRSIEVEYKAAASVYETLTFIAQKSTDSSAFAGVSMVVTYDGEGHTYTTGSDGKVTAQIPLGKSYTVALQRPTGYYFLGGSSFSFTAEQNQRIIYGMLASANSGAFIVCSNGDEVTLADWSTSGHVASDAIAIKIATTELYDNDGIFAISIDEMGVTQNTSYPKRKWSSVNALFTSIPTITNVSQTNKPYYYDGYTASQLIQTEGDTTGNDTPAVDWTLAKSLTVNGIEHQGFLLSLGQMIVLWQNSAEIDAILDTVRPAHAYTLRGLPDTKWTSTQYSETKSWTFNTVQRSDYTKSYSNVAVVAYDFN